MKTLKTKSTKHLKLIQDAIGKVKSNSNRIIGDCYRSMRPRFVNWFCKNHNLSKRETIELYQHAFTILYINIKEDRITSLNNTIETYLFGIGKNLVKEIMRAKNKTEVISVQDDHLIEYDQEVKDDLIYKMTVVREMLQKIGDPCRSILLMYYFKNFSMESIANNLGYKHSGVAKKKKCECLQKIRKQFKTAVWENDACISSSGYELLPANTDLEMADFE